MNKKIKIRPERENNFQAVREVVELAFRDVEDSDQSRPHLVGHLQKTGAYTSELSSVTKLDSEIIGRFMMNKAEIVSEDQSVIPPGLVPVSAVSKYQRIGASSALVRGAHKQAGELGYKLAVLLGRKDYYPRFGYKRAIDFGVELPFDALNEYHMVVKLAPEGPKDVHRMIKYARPSVE